MSDYIDPVTGKRPCEMNIVEWCDWEVRARHEFYAEKAKAKQANKARRRENRVQWIESLLHALAGNDARTIAERIDQAHYPEAWGVFPPGDPRGSRLEESE